MEAEKKTTVKNAANGVTGLETMFSSAFTKLCKDSGFGIDRLINILSIKPRQILGIKPPSIKHGEKAEITLFDPEAWRIIDDGFFNSKSKNSAFKGKKLYGMVCATVNGKRVRINN
jgi:dihydroorotase